MDSQQHDLRYAMWVHSCAAVATPQQLAVGNALDRLNETPNQPGRAP
ncbi:hypothetical protein [Streptomyces aureus]